MRFSITQTGLLIYSSPFYWTVTRIFRIQLLEWTLTSLYRSNRRFFYNRPIGGLDRLDQRGTLRKDSRSKYLLPTIT
ncbi:hypothetical protein [Sphingobacterium mizutaii]|uniref:hypothetical protein n=1 Tax=Sphingobacterium mizutaii TaxID=1010 RepID=UPI0011BEADFF|nr:hypothetical protein [Sphingobacterium mizutaii]